MKFNAICRRYSWNYKLIINAIASIESQEYIPETWLEAKHLTALLPGDEDGYCKAEILSRETLNDLYQQLAEIEMEFAAANATK